MSYETKALLVSIIEYVKELKKGEEGEKIYKYLKKIANVEGVIV